MIDPRGYKAGRAVRVAPLAEAMQANKETAFFKEYREKGVPASKVPASVIGPLMERVMDAPEERLLAVGPILERGWHDPPHSFASFACDMCGEMVAEPYGRVLGDKKVCIPCRAKATSEG